MGRPISAHGTSSLPSPPEQVLWGLGTNHYTVMDRHVARSRCFAGTVSLKGIGAMGTGQGVRGTNNEAGGGWLKPRRG